MCGTACPSAWSAVTEHRNSMQRPNRTWSVRSPVSPTESARRGMSSSFHQGSWSRLARAGRQGSRTRDGEDSKPGKWLVHLDETRNENDPFVAMFVENPRIVSDPNYIQSLKLVKVSKIFLFTVFMHIVILFRSWNVFIRWIHVLIKMRSFNCMLIWKFKIH